MFRKLKLAENYVTDFFFISKSSAAWNLVCVEIEKPSSRYFKDNSEEFHSDFTAATMQINTLRAWARNQSNIEHLLKETLDPIFIPHSMRGNPVRAKFILVLGRSQEYKSQRRRNLITEWQQSDLEVLSFDSLLNGYDSNEGVYLASRSNSRVHILSDEFVSDAPLDSIEPDQLEISQKLYDATLANRSKWRSRQFGGGYILDERLPKIAIRK